MDNTNISLQPCDTANEIIYVKECRAHLNRRLNELQSSTKVLPPEMLSEIFKHACFDNDSDGIRPLFQISAVCSHWCQTARSTPCLWATLRLIIDVGNPRSNANILQLWLANIRGPTLTLELINVGGGGITDPFKHIFSMKQNSEKIRELKLCAPHPSWMPFITKNCVNLEKLEITGLPCGEINLENQLHLRTLILTQPARAQPIKLSPSLNITTLELNNVTDHSTCLGLLSECQHSLTNLSIKPSFYSSEGYSGGLPITFGRLKTLHLRISSTLEAFISRMKFPVLANLTLELDLDEDEYEVEKLSPLFKSLPRVPTTFEISKCSEAECEFSQKLFQSPDCLFFNADQFQELVVITTLERDSTPILKMLSGSVRVFRCLRRLSVYACSFLNPYTFSNHLFKVLEIRGFGLAGPLHLEIQISRRQLGEWMVCYLLVERLRRKGYSISFNLDIYDD